MSGGAQVASTASKSAGGLGSLAQIAPMLMAMKQQPGGGAAPMAHPMMGAGGAQPMAPMPAPPMSGAPMPGGAPPGLLGGMGGMGGASGMPPGGPAMQNPQMQQLMMQRGLLGGGGVRPY